MKCLPRAARLAPCALAFTCCGALGAPSITLSTTIGHPKVATDVSGTGFGASEAVDVYFDTTDMALDVTDGSGNFGADTLRIPANALPGSHWITAIGRSDGVASHRAFIVSTAWASHGFNERGRRRNPYENIIDATNVANLDVAWTAATGSFFGTSSPAVSSIGATYNPRIFVGSDDGKFYAFDVNGKVKWTATTGGFVDSSPAIGPNGIVYVASRDGKLYAFKVATGAAAWASAATTAAQVLSSPAVAGGIVYVGSDDNKLYAFDAATGAPAWAAPAITGGPIGYSSPAVANGQVFIGSNDHKFYAFDAATGASQWSFSTGNYVISSPAVANGTVYFGGYDGNVYALNAKTGVLRWSYTTGGSIDTSPAVAGGFVYIGSFDSKLYAIDARTGTLAWTGAVDTGGIVYSSPAVANGLVYVANGNGDGQLYAFNANGCGASTCSPLWAGLTGAGIASSPTVSDGMVFVGSIDHNLYAFALDAGYSAVYRHRNTAPPRYSSLHPDFRLKPVKH